MVEGIGIDIIEIERIAAAVAKDRFRERVFTPAEREYCDAASSAERYAGRFAAKEAVAKALGLSLNWREVEILPTPQGPPRVVLHGHAARRLGDRSVLISISHCRSCAVAQALIVREPPHGFAG